jgi:hypothetical protein
MTLQPGLGLCGCCDRHLVIQSAVRGAKFDQFAQNPKRVESVRLSFTDGEQRH